MSYLPEVAWSTIASNVTLGASAYRYYITVNPLDPNEAGASPMTVAINDWFIDFAGYPFLIEEVNGSILTVYDILERGDGVVSAYAPYANKLGYVYRPLNGAIILTQAQLRKLDESAKDVIQPIEKGIQWIYRGIRLVSVEDDYTNITKLDLSKNLTYSYTENGGWQGGNSAEIDINISLGTGAKNEVAYTNNGDGTLTIQTTNFALYDNALGTGYPNIYTVNGGAVSFTDNTYNYVIVNYNSGTPILQVITDVTLINETTIIPVFSVLRRGNVLCVTNWDELGNAKVDKLHQSIVKTQRYRRESGLSISIPSTGTPRRVSLTSGTVWIGAIDISMESVISGDVGVTMFEYYKTGGVWGYSSASQLNNTYYQGTTDRVSLTANRYAVAFVYRGVESNKHLYFVYGTGDYTLAQAQAASVPSDLPIAIRSHTILIGRVIIQKSSDTITELASAFDTVFTIQPIDNHAGLSNLGWTVSGHTATAGSVPVFNSLGVAIEASLTNGYVPYKTTNGLGNSPLFTNGTKVSIGTTTQVYKFVVSGTDASPAHVGIIATDTSATYIRFGYSGEYNAGIAYQSTATGFLSLRTGGHTTSEDRLVIKDTGISYFTNRLGIKRTLPIYDLDVNGTTRLSTLNGLILGTIGELSAVSGVQGDILYHNGTTWTVLNAGTNGYYLKTQGTGANPIWAASTATPGGSDTYVQFNDGGGFGGTSGLVFDKTTNDLTCTGYYKGKNIETNTTTLSTVVGINAGLNEDKTSARYNAIYGCGSGQDIATGLANSYFGGRSGLYSTGSYCIGVGYEALFGTIGNNCTAVGARAGGQSGKSVAGAVYYGYYAGYYETGSNKLFIDNQNRTNEATSRTSSMIYGEFNSTVNLQKIYLNASTYTKRVVKAYQALTSASTVTMNVRDGQNARITIGHNVTLTLSNLEDGDEGNIVVTQDATGGRTLTISPTPKVINGGTGAIVLTAAANATDMLSYTYTNSILYITYGKNYS